MSHDMSEIQQAISGFVMANNNLKYYRKSNIVVRNDILTMKTVKIISGGGSGHEPMSLGFVGEGMLTAAVCGELFASPSYLNILKAILTVGQPGSDVLLIILNYTGDRLNFGLAAEMAKSQYGYNVEMLLVNEDCSIEHPLKTVGKRGLAGAILIQKMAGAMAALGHSLAEIYDFCNDILVEERMVTIGFTFESSRDGLKKIEIGRGIHGEPGSMTLPDGVEFEDIVEVLFKKIERKIPYMNETTRATEILLFFNSLGGNSELQMSKFIYQTLKRVQLDYKIGPVMQGALCTSQKQEGISLTVLSLHKNKDKILEYLNYPIKVAANVPFPCLKQIDSPDDHPIARYDTEYAPEITEYDERCYQVKHNEQYGIEAAKKALNGLCDLAITCEKILNKVDEEFGDGDTGTLLKVGCLGIKEAILNDKINLAYPAVMLHDLTKVIQASGMGGTMGVLFSIFFEAAAKAFQEDVTIYRQLGDVNEVGMTQFWVVALKKGAAAISRYGLAEEGDRTALDALWPGIRALEKALEVNPSIKEQLEEFADGCEAGAENTKTMIPKAGRACYKFSDMKEEEFHAEANDAGAQVVAIIARATFEAVRSILNKYKIG